MDTASKLDVLGHGGDMLGVDGTQVGIFKKTNQVSLTGILLNNHSRTGNRDQSWSLEQFHKPGAGMEASW